MPGAATVAGDQHRMLQRTGHHAAIGSGSFGSSSSVTSHSDPLSHMHKLVHRASLRNWSY
jgi:hypothetical protein